MKKIFSLLLVVLMLVLVGCEDKENNPESKPRKEITYSIPSIDADDVEVEEAEYSRIGNDIIFINRITPKFFESPETELTAKVKITKYCGDTDIKVFETDVAALFKAKILTCYKGDFKPGDDIYIMQYFSGHGIVESGFPLFGISDVMLLNLMHFTNKDVKTEDNIFQVVEDRFGIVDITKYNNIEYAINRGDVNFLEEFNATPVDEPLMKNVLNYYYKQDPIRKGIVPINQVYVFKDLEKVLIERKFKNENK